MPLNAFVIRRGSVLRYAHTGAQRTERTDAAHGEKIFFPLLVTCHRTLIRTGRNGVWQFRLGFWEGNLFPSGRRVRLTQRWSWHYRIAWRDTERKMLMLLANQRPALKWIASARRQKYDAVCLLSKNIATRPMHPFRPLHSSVRVPLPSQGRLYFVELVGKLIGMGSHNMVINHLWKKYHF
jgi:hypothetical protein